MNIYQITGCIWSLFWGYWGLLASFTRMRIKKEAKGQGGLQRTSHLIVVLIAFAITYFRFELTDRIIIPLYFVKYIGFIILMLSLGLAIIARTTLGRNWSGAIQKVKGQRLIRKGPYKYIRHPIYTGIVFGFCGTFLVFETLPSLVGFIIILISYLVKIKMEEEFLLVEFGDEYRNYKSESWALIPYIF